MKMKRQDFLIYQALTDEMVQANLPVVTSTDTIF